jgi:hypothetical protein
MSADPAVQVRGAATPDEIAAVLAALQLRARSRRAADRLEQWRRLRQQALRENG